MAFSFVQSSVVTGSGNQAISLTGVAAGNVLVAFAVGTTNWTVTGVSDAQGSYTQIAGVAGTSTNDGSFAFGLANANAGTHAVTISTDAGGAWGTACLCEISGASTSSPFDVGAALFVANGGYTATTDGLSFGNATTTTNGELILTFMSPGGTNDQATAGTGFSIVVNSTASAVSNHSYVQTKTQTTAGSITPTMSPTGTGDAWSTVWIAIKPVVASNTGITPLVGSVTEAGVAPTLTPGVNTLITPFVARRGRVLAPDDRILVPNRKIFLPRVKAA